MKSRKTVGIFDASRRYAATVADGRGRQSRLIIDGLVVVRETIRVGYGSLTANNEN